MEHHSLVKGLRIKDAYFSEVHTPIDHNIHLPLLLLFLVVLVPLVPACSVRIVHTQPELVLAFSSSVVVHDGDLQGQQEDLQEDLQDLDLRGLDQWVAYWQLLLEMAAVVEVVADCRGQKWEACQQSCEVGDLEFVLEEQEEEEHQEQQLVVEAAAAEPIDCPYDDPINNEEETKLTSDDLVCISGYFVTAAHIIMYLDG